jgi:putative endonuclease
VAANDRSALGIQGEQLAARFLLDRGHSILATRFRTRLGELDIVTRSGEHIYFVEVKTRRTKGTGSHYGSGLEAVDFRKQRRITRLAQLFLERHNLWDLTPHFAVIGIEQQDSSASVHFLPDAFDAA